PIVTSSRASKLKMLSTVKSLLDYGLFQIILKLSLFVQRHLSIGIISSSVKLSIIKEQPLMAKN
ncbi:MAG: hypothetical protein WBL54_08280, partial [Nitrososphaeraceae archaeon]